MDNNYNDENDGIRPVFLKGCLFIIAAVVLIAVGFFFTVGILSVINKTSPAELLRGNNGFCRQHNSFPARHTGKGK